MNWEDAKLFLSVAREEQMLSAAKRLKISQATLSRRMAMLEASVGCPLLDRSTQGCKLTEHGRHFFEMAEQAEAAFLGGLSRLKDMGEDITGTVRIGAPDGFGATFLAARLSYVHKALPNLHVQLVPVPMNFSLSQREADIAIMVGRPHKGRLRAKRLTDYTLHMYAARSYLDAHSAPQSSADLKDHTLIGYVQDLIHTPELNYAQEFVKDWRSSIEVSTSVGQLQAVLSGAGIGVLHDFMARAHPELVPVLPERRVTRQYWTVWHENLRAAKRIKAIVDVLDHLVQDERSIFTPDYKI